MRQLYTALWAGAAIVLSACNNAGPIGAYDGGTTSGAASTSTASTSSTSTSSTSSGSTNGRTTTSSSSSTSGSSASSGSTTASSTTGQRTTTSSSSGSTTGAPLCNDCRQADCPCGGQAPYCDDSNGRCQACRNSGDCKSPAAPQCELDASVCVSCLGDADCRTDPLRTHCGSDLSCVACASDSDCDPDAGTPRCGIDRTSPLYGQCWECANETQCILGEICDPFRGVCQDDCRYGSPCPQGLTCGQLTGQCTVGACSIDQDCASAVDSDGGATPICDPVYANCVICADDLECPTGQHCQTNPLATGYGSCQACVGSGQGQCDGAHGWLCEENGNCEQDCRVDAGYAVCGWGIEGEMVSLPACQQTTGLCVQCLSSADCAQLQQLGVTANPLCDAPTASCVQCRGPADCSFENAGCLPATGCGQCRHDSDCPTGQICHDTPGFPASQGGPEYCFCNDDNSCGGGSCVTGGVGFNYNPYNLLQGSYRGYTGQCYCNGDAGAQCDPGATCLSVLGGNVNNSNNPGHCFFDGGVRQ